MQLSDRPLKRQMVRLGIRLLCGAKWGHAQDWTPHLRLIPPSENRRGSVYYKQKKLTELFTFREFQEATQPYCVIVGSGPSLAPQDLGHLGDGSLILLNGAIIRIAQASNAQSVFLAIEDERFIWRRYEMVRQYVNEQTRLLLSVSVLRALAELDPEWLSDRTVFLIENLLKPYGEPRRQLNDPGLARHITTDGQVAYSMAPQQGVIPAGTVAFSALQWVMARRPSTIGFAGIDISNAHQTRFYESPSDRAGSGIRLAEGKILQHFALAAEGLRSHGATLETYSSFSALGEIGIPYNPCLDSRAISWRKRVA